MDLEELKRILKEDKGKIIIVEDGEPVMIVLPYEKSSISSSTESVPEPSKPQKEAESSVEELTIDDLPI